MDLLEAIKNRRSIRKFEDKDVEREKIGILLNACKWSPSAGNRQPWEVIVVRNEGKKEELADAALNQKWITRAPVILVMCINKSLAKATYGQRGVELYGIQSTAAAVQNILLTAHSLGLGGCWVGAFDEEDVSFALECPEKIRPVAIIPIGHPKEKSSPTSRHEISDFVHVDKYGKKSKKEWKGIKTYLENMKGKLKKFKEK